MEEPPAIHLVINTHSSDANDSGECDWCLVRLTERYVSCLLGYMDEVRRLRRSDRDVYGLERWDFAAAYCRDNDRLGRLRGIKGVSVEDTPPDEPTLLAEEPHLEEADFRRVECQSVQVTEDELCWRACVKHTDIRIESASVTRETLLGTHRRLGGARKGRQSGRPKPIPPVVQSIHDLLYLDMQDGREFYNPEKAWDADTMTRIAEIVAEFIPRPSSTHPDQE